MAIDTTNTVNTSANASSGASAQTGLNNDYDQFLKLLTTQLTNQDPTAPLDTNQVTQQIASLSQVQQALNTNTKLDQLISYFGSSQANEAVSYIGKQVDATGNQITLAGSQAALVYSLPDGAVKANVTISDSKGNTVYSSAGTTVAGRNQLLWDGTNDQTSDAIADGVYNFKVDATDADGKAVTATTYTTGTVTAVNTENGTNSLLLGKLSIPLSTVQSIYTAGTNPGA